ncbi:MAG: tartrate-resistant acid phosphatase type 5 family protein [Chitinophagaceae bacterium]
MKYILISLALCIVNISVHAQTLVKDLGYRGGSIAGIKKIDNALHFILMGDWGRNGENYQKEVAANMGKAAHDLGASFVVATGDNFYPYGVQSTQDYHWISSYETIYTAQSLHVKWYVVLGNHDYASNPDAQVAYTKISSRWTMPARYYTKSFTVGKDSVLMAFLDTDAIEKELRGQAHDSVKYVEGAVAKQRQWLEKLLASSNAKWKIVVGHHPLYTGGWRKDDEDTKKMRDFLEPLFSQYNVDLYLCGHEHHLEYTKPNGKTHYIISGAASEARPAALNPEGGKFIAAEQGFATMSVAADKVLVQFINYQGKILNSSTITK